MPPLPLGAASTHTPLECWIGPGAPAPRAGWISMLLLGLPRNAVRPPGSTDGQTVGAVQPAALSFATPHRERRRRGRLAVVRARVDSPRSAKPEPGGSACCCSKTLPKKCDHPAQRTEPCHPVRMEPFAGREGLRDPDCGLVRDDWPDLPARAGWVSMLLLEWLRKQWNHPAQRNLSSVASSARSWPRINGAEAMAHCDRNSTPR